MIFRQIVPTREITTETEKTFLVRGRAAYFLHRPNAAASVAPTLIRHCARRSWCVVGTVCLSVSVCLCVDYRRAVYDSQLTLSDCDAVNSSSANYYAQSPPASRLSRPPSAPATGDDVTPASPPSRRSQHSAPQVRAGFENTCAKQPPPRHFIRYDTISAFCDGTSRYGVPENLTTG